VFPVDVVMESKPQGHGYTVMECVADNPFFPKGLSLKGHEFHYSRIVTDGRPLSLVFKMSKGQGIVPGWDGLCHKNVLAGYSHLHAMGNEKWVEAMVRNALHFREQRDKLPGPAVNQVDTKPAVLQLSKRQTMI